VDAHGGPQHPVEVGQLQHRAHLLGRAGDAQVAARLPGRLQARDQRPEPGRVDEVGLAQVDEDVRVACRDGPAG
jgi:hypothetical protein